MVNFRQFQISGKHFWGFKRQIDLDLVDSSNDIIKIMKNKIKEFLKSENLEILIEKLNEKRYHLISLGKILIETEPNSVIYICDHCHCDCCN